MRAATVTLRPDLDITKTARISCRNGWNSIKAGSTCVLHYHCKKTCPIPMGDFKAHAGTIAVLEHKKKILPAVLRCLHVW